ncbi:MAG: hypothetical protein ACKOFX_07410 [Solirubrobacterales bacterium]
MFFGTFFVPGMQTQIGSRSHVAPQRRQAGGAEAAPSASMAALGTAKHAVRRSGVDLMGWSPVGRGQKSKSIRMP